MLAPARPSCGPSSAARPLVKCSDTVLSVASPSAPPTCCMVFSTPEPMPESSARTWCTAVRVSGTNVRPMPTAIRTMNGRIEVQ